MNCTICLQEYTERQTCKTCSKSICSECVRQHLLKIHARCPFCRTTFPDNCILNQKFVSSEDKFLHYIKLFMNRLNLMSTADNTISSEYNNLMRILLTGFKHPLALNLVNDNTFCEILTQRLLLMIEESKNLPELNSFLQSEYQFFKKK